MTGACLGVTTPRSSTLAQALQQQKMLAMLIVIYSEIISSKVLLCTIVVLSGFGWPDRIDLGQPDVD